ncbi:hypothetical protein [Paraburkholderia acidicola]|nr:hypothetical protein [Paraburkholderia acidicola]
MTTLLESSAGSDANGGAKMSYAAGGGSPFSGADKPAADVLRERAGSSSPQSAGDLSNEGAAGAVDAQGAETAYGRVLSSSQDHAGALTASPYDTDLTSTSRQAGPAEESVVWAASPMIALRRLHAAETPADRTQAEPAEDAGQTRRGATDIDDTQPHAAQSGMRLYAEWSGDDVRIWLGADRTEAPAVVPLVSRLRQWLAGHGVRLLGVICNGRTVEQRDNASFHEQRLADTDDFFAAPQPHSHLKELP